MPKRTTPHRVRLMEALVDAEEAASYLNAAIEDSPAMFLDALRDVAQARQMKKVANESGVSRESLYRALSKEGNPTLDTLASVLAAVGLYIHVTPKEGHGVKGHSPAPKRTARPARPRVNRRALEAENSAASCQGSFPFMNEQQVAGVEIPEVQAQATASVSLSTFQYAARELKNEYHEWANINPAFAAAENAKAINSLTNSL